MTTIYQWPFVLAVIALIVSAYRAIRDRSPRLAAVFAVGVAFRALAGSSLFVVSFLGLPALTNLQLGGGFWRLAPDAQVYFQAASNAAANGMSSIGSATPSPAYVRALAIWFRAAGASPATAVLFNVMCFAAAAALIVRIARRSEAIAAAPLVAVAFAPVLLLSSSQVLKDSLFTLAVVMVFAGAAVLCGAATIGPPKRDVAAAAAAIAIGIALVAGIRAYFALILWIGGVIAASVEVARAPRPRLRIAGAAAGLLALFWIAFALGAQDYYSYYSDLFARATGVPFPPIPGVHAGGGGVGIDERGFASLTGTLWRLRRGFIWSGGATSLFREAFGASGLEAILDIGVGLLALFVPISILKWTSLVQFTGGRGLLLLTDLDTLFLDAMIAASVFCVLDARRRGARSAAFLTFALFAGVLTAVLLAFVVTNYGTLFRLRLMAALPLWLLPLGLGRMPVAAPSDVQQKEGPGRDPLHPAERRAATA